jgi:hypothetical protein
MRQHAPLDPGQAAWELLPLFFATQAIDIAHARCGAATENGRNTDRRYFPGERSVNDAAPACFCAIRFARRTASGIATGAWSRTNASPAAASCRSTCFHVGEINDSQERAVSRGSLRGDSAGRLDRLVEAERASVPAAAMGRPAGWRSLWEELQPDRFWTERLPAIRKATRWDPGTVRAGGLSPVGAEGAIGGCIGMVRAHGVGRPFRRRFRTGPHPQTLSMSRPAARTQKRRRSVRSPDGALARSFQRLRSVALRSHQHPI